MTSFYTKGRRVGYTGRGDEVTSYNEVFALKTVRLADSFRNSGIQDELNMFTTHWKIEEYTNTGLNIWIACPDIRKLVTESRPIGTPTSNMRNAQTVEEKKRKLFIPNHKLVS